MKEKIMFFDAGPIISLVMSRLSWILPALKKQFNGRFYITPAVRYELVDRPLTMKRFEFEALQVLKMIREGTLEIYDKIPAQKVKKLTTLANSAFKVRNKTIDILQAGEVESVVAALEMKAEAVVIDERTLRLLIEKNTAMKKLLKGRFRTNVVVDSVKVAAFAAYFKNLFIIRSIELASVAYKFGLLNSYIPPRKGGRSVLVDSILWATKSNGCAVTEHEIEEMKGILLKK